MMIRCTEQSNPVNVKVSRRHVIAAGWKDREAGEAPIWLASHDPANHPFSK
jgi:hypothetical protein